MTTHVHILVAEDEAMAAMAVRLFLESAGYTLTLTHDGADALEAAERQPFNLPLTDLWTPVMDGRNLIRSLRARCPHLPVIVMIGSPPSAGIKELQDDDPGMMTLLAKPVHPSSLLAAIRTAPESGAPPC